MKKIKDIKLSSIKSYSNTLIFIVVLLSFAATNLPQYALVLLLGAVLALAGIAVLQVKFWRCPRCHRWLGLNLNITQCPRCGKRLEMGQEEETKESRKKSKNKK